MNGASLIDGLGWTLLHFIWQGALIALATALLLALTRHSRPAVRYNIACTALLACLLWPAAELALRLQGGDMLTAQMRFADAFVAGSARGAPDGLLAWLQSQMLWVVGFWAMCAALLAARLAAGLLWIRRAGRSERGDPGLQAVVSRLAAAFGVRRDVQVRIVERIDSPVTAGWLRPVILVPASLLSGMPHELLEALLAHEMGHVRRMDYLVNLGQNVIEILLFYHPAVWWISGRIRVEREQIADDLAARHSCAPRTLARALSELERIQFSRPRLAIAANGGQLLERVRRLVQPDVESVNWKAALPLIGLAAACASIYAHASVRGTPVPALAPLQAWAGAGPAVPLPGASASAPAPASAVRQAPAPQPATQSATQSAPAPVMVAGGQAAEPMPAAAPAAAQESAAVRLGEPDATGAPAADERAGEPPVTPVKPLSGEEPRQLPAASGPGAALPDEAMPLADQPPTANFRSCKKPSWPAAALSEGRTGTVTLAFKIGTDGKVVESRVRRSSGHGDLDQAAREGIELCSFNPGIKDGQRVAAWMNIQYVWTLQ